MAQPDPDDDPTQVCHPSALAENGLERKISADGHSQKGIGCILLFIDGVPVLSRCKWRQRKIERDTHASTSKCKAVTKS